MIQSPPWSLPPQTIQKPLSFTTEIVIYGGGPSGIFCALELARCGVNVILIEKNHHLLGGFSGRTLPKLMLGLNDSVSRLVSGMGDFKTEKILTLGLQSRQLWMERNLFHETGGWHIAAEVREEKEIHHSLQFLNTKELWRSKASENKFGAAFFSEDEGLINRQAASDFLFNELHNLGVKMHFGCSIFDTRIRNNTVITQTSLGDFHSDLLLSSQGWESIKMDPFFAQALTPVREQWVAYPCSDIVELHHMQYGHQQWATLGDHLIYGGCRWASPHFEIGERTHILNPKIHEHLKRNAKQRYPLIQSPTHAWTSIMTQSCDGLPIVGALPGRQNELCCLGLSNNSFSLGPALGTALAGMLVGKESFRLPQWLQPQRFSL